jgi:hypothetical protein
LRAPEIIMSYNAPDLRSVTLRLEFSIADAVAQRGLLPVLGAALRAWWKRPRLPPNLPDYLREDVGLQPEGRVVYWMDVPINPSTPTLLPPKL